MALSVKGAKGVVVDEWIIRTLPLPVADLAREERCELARVRLRIIQPTNRPGGRCAPSRYARVDVGDITILALDSANPFGGVGGSLDSDQCAWLVQKLGELRDRFVILAMHDCSRTLTSDAVPAGASPRVLGPEVTVLLLAHPSVIAWVSNTLHERMGIRHGDAAHGFWEIPGLATGRGSPLEGGLTVSVEARQHDRAVVIAGALTGDAGARWELRDPFGSAPSHVTSGGRRAPAAGPR